MQSTDDEKALSARIEDLRYQLDDIIAHQCVMCGDVMIDSIHVPFIGEEEDDIAASWAV